MDFEFLSLKRRKKSCGVDARRNDELLSVRNGMQPISHPEKDKHVLEKLIPAEMDVRVPAFFFPLFQPSGNSSIYHIPRVYIRKLKPSCFELK